MDAKEQLTCARRGRMTKSRRHECINSFRDTSVADGVPAEPQTVEKAYLRRDKFPSFLLSVGHIGKAAVFVAMLLRLSPAGCRKILGSKLDSMRVWRHTGKHEAFSDR